MHQGLRIGLIGLGRHGLRYAHHLTRGDVPRAKFAAFWRRDQTRAAEASIAMEADFEPDVTRLISRKDVDAFVVAVPVALHLPLALLIARQRKPLLLEKPIARTMEEGAQIVSAFEDAGVLLTVAQTLRFDPLVLALRESASRSGELRGFSFQQRLEPRGLEWEDDPVIAGGGVLLQTGIHTIDALRFVTRTDRIEVEAAAFSRIQYERNEDLARLLLRLRGTPLAGSADAAIAGDLRASKIGDSRHLEFELYFEKSALTADLVARTLTVSEGRSRSVQAVPEAPTVAEVLRAFVACIERGGHGNPVSGKDALASLSVVEEAYSDGHWIGGRRRKFPSFIL